MCRTITQLEAVCKMCRVCTTYIYCVTDTEHRTSRLYMYVCICVHELAGRVVRSDRQQLNVRAVGSLHK